MSFVTIPFVDFSKYQGRWYTVAKIPFEWDNSCICTYADYTFNGTHMNVVNTCVLEGGKTYIKKGTAVIPNLTEPGKLMVSFEDQLIQQSGNVKISKAGDYYLHYTDYIKYAVVGSPSGEYLWILSRSQDTPPLSDLQILKAFLLNLGYDDKKIIFEKRIKLH